MHSLKFPFLLLFLFSTSFFAQGGTIDSLKKELQKSRDTFGKTKALNLLSNQFNINGQYDSALYFATQAIEIVKKGLSVGKESEIIPLKKEQAESYMNKGYSYRLKNNSPEALRYYFLELRIRETLGEKKALATCYSNLAAIYFNLEKYQESLKNQNKALKLREDYGDKNGIASSYNLIGNDYFQLGNYDASLKSYFTSLKIREEIGDKQGIFKTTLDIAGIYQYTGNYKEAINFFSKALAISKEIGDKKNSIGTYLSMAIFYGERGSEPDALKNYSEALKLSEEINDKQTAAYIYYLLGSFYLKRDNYQSAVKNLNNGLKMASAINYSWCLENLYDKLKEAYEKTKNYEKAFESYKKYILYHDSTLSKLNSKKIVQEEMRYAFEKKEENEKIIKEKNKLQEEAKSKRQKLIILTVIIILILLAFFAIFIFRALQVTRKQKEIIEEKNKNITDSITYASRLQTAILPPLIRFKEYLPKSFILYKPKDIVAGDFYWMETILEKNLIFVAAGDCTGHGVPGAMVSVVCANALNRAVKEFGCVEPGKILDKATELVIETFIKEKGGEDSGSDGNVKDGMDISLLAIDYKNSLLHWSGANNPLYYITNKELRIIKADKQPVSAHIRHTPFTTHTIPLQIGTILYLFSDGYSDQFGGPKGKKYSNARFREKLIDIATLDMSSQKEALNRSFEDWKGKEEQVDDVIIIGIRI